MEDCNKNKSSLPRDGINLSRLTDPVERFDQLNLRELLLRGINDYGLVHPSPVQQRALKPCILGYNIIIQSQAGTGRTTTYIIALLQQIDLNCSDCQAIILVPTRELAQAVCRIVIELGKHMNVTCHACINSNYVREDLKCFEAGSQVVVGTPGRIYDLLKASILRTANVKMLILDEMDELLSRGFKDRMDDILPLIPSTVQTILLTATMSNDLSDLARKSMVKPVEILFPREERTLEGIRQFYVNIEREEWKLSILCDLCTVLPITQAIIFCHGKENVDLIAQTLRAQHLTVSTLQDAMDRDQQEAQMKEFRTGSSRIMVRTDLPGVHIDIAQVSVMINYDLPHQPEIYLHRVGRCGRFGRRGVSISLITNADRHELRDIEQWYQTRIEEMPEDVTDLI